MDARSKQGHRERFTTASLGGLVLQAAHWGDPARPTLVLLHGGGANSHWWDHLAPELARRFRVVALDFRGHGDSDYPETLEPGAFQRDLEALLEHLGVSDAVLMGHSMGGHVALDHAAHRSGVRALVAIEISRGAPRRESRRTRLALAARRSYPTREAAVRRYRFLPTAEGASESLRRHIAEQSVCEEPDGRFGFKFDPRWFTLPRRPPPPLAQIACPVLLVRGSDSELLSADGARELVAAIPGAELAEIAATGHNVHLEDPGAVLAAANGFLARRL